MSDRATSTTPDDADSGSTRTMDTLETFSLLAQETRLTILRELAASGAADEREPVSFAELRRRVGTADSGRFNYHLDKLQPQFVTHVDEEGGATGYRPTWAGINVIGAAMAGQFAGDSIGGDTERECPQCGAAATIAHDNGVLHLDCPNHEFSMPVPAGAAENRDLDGLFEVGIALTSRLIDLAREGICPNCYDAIVVEPVEDDDGRVLFHDTCDRCRATMAVPVGMFVGRHPAIVAFYHDRGVDLDAESLWSVDWADPGAERILERDPFRLELTIECDGDVLRAVIDETGDPIEIEIE